MNFRELISKIADDYRGRASVSDVLGGMSAKDIAGRYGVTVRTAQRWRKGTHAPSLGNVSKIRDDDERVAATALRNANHIDLEDIDIEYPGGNYKRGGKRHVGMIRGNDFFGNVADALDAGDMDDAEQEMSDGALGAYGMRGSSRGSGRTRPARNSSSMQGLRVRDYGDRGDLV